MDSQAERDNAAIAETIAQRAMAQVQDAVASGAVAGSSQLKNQLHSLIDAMFAA